MKRYFKSTDGRVTVFRASDTRDYRSACFVSLVDDAGHARLKDAVQFSGAAPTSFLGGWPASEITKAEYNQLVALKQQRMRAAGETLQFSTAPRDSWISNHVLDEESR